MIKYRANINKIIMINLQSLSVSKLLTVTEIESIILKIKIEVMESTVDLTIKTDFENFLSKENILGLALKCHQRYTADRNTLNTPSFLEMKWPILVPLLISGIIAFSLLVIDIFQPFAAWNQTMVFNGFFVGAALIGFRKIHNSYVNSLESQYLNETEILKSKIFGIIYENFNSLYFNRSSHAS
jgi:hypothetical protein